MSFFHRWRSTAYLFLLVLLSVGEAHAGSPAPMPERRTNLEPWTDVLKDPARDLTIEDVASGPADAEFRPIAEVRFPLSDRFGDAAWWTRVSVTNPTRRNVSWVFNVAHRQFDEIDIHVFEDGRPLWSVRTGDHRPPPSGVLSGEGYAFPITTSAAATTEIFVRYAYSGSGLVRLHTEAWPKDGFEAYQADAFLMHGIRFGMLICLVVISIAVYATLRSREILYYAIYVAVMAVSFFGTTQLAHHYFHWLGPNVLDALPILSIAGLTASGLAFSREFLGIRTRFPRLDRAVLAALGSTVVPVVALAFGLRNVAFLFIPLHFLLLASAPIVGGIFWYRGHPCARLYTVAWIFFDIALAAYAARILSLTPDSIPIIWIPRFAIVFEVLFLSFALADRIRRLKDERANIERRYLDSVLTARDELERQVAIRTRELKAARHAAESLARTDPLTGIANRRAFFEASETEILRLRRYGQDMTLVMIDIDHFKSINDRFGHETGDRVLTSIARTLDDGKRATDTLGRIGGEEFALLLPETELTSALNLVERLRLEVSELRIEKEGEVIAVTASFGVTSADAGEPSLNDMLMRADKALYRAKSSGRNRVVAFDESLEPSAA